ncbi:unnamed protein product, partial [Rotaria sordida]
MTGELKLENAKWHVAETAAREQLLIITELHQSLSIANATTHAQHNLVQSSSRSICILMITLPFF